MAYLGFAKQTSACSSSDAIVTRYDALEQPNGGLQALTLLLYGILKECAVVTNNAFNSFIANIDIKLPRCLSESFNN